MWAYKIIVASRDYATSRQIYNELAIRFMFLLLSRLEALHACFNYNVWSIPIKAYLLYKAVDCLAVEC